jgi:tRNA nucleotidyltransferase (CCA-adding enzyme)
MRVSLPLEVIALVSFLQKAGFTAEVVGGAVRDTLLKRPTNDWDLTTNAKPEEIQKIFPEHFYENEFGTVGITRQHIREQLGWSVEGISEENLGEIFEITTYRSDSTYSDHRRPDAVTWGKTLEEDLARRDFTINAMAFSFTADTHDWHGAFQKETFDVDATLIDPYKGKDDLQAKTIKTVGDPAQRFQEDALRMLRAVRFGAQLEYVIDMEVAIALQQNAGLIAHVSWERIRDEFLKILVTDYVEQSLTLLATTGLLQYILPELLEAKGIDQRGHHEYDVWTHSIRACASCPSRDPIVRLATLLHDIAKPETQAPLEGVEGEYTFFNHEVIGARTAKEIAQRFKLSKEDTQRIFTLVRWHMFHYQTSMTDAAIRRFIRRVGAENIEDIMALREADRLGSGSKRTSWRLEEMKERIEAQFHQPMQVRDLVIKGEDVMEVLSIPPSRKVGDILQILFEEVLDEPEKNTREYLLGRLDEIKAL